MSKKKKQSGKQQEESKKDSKSMPEKKGDQNSGDKPGTQSKSNSKQKSYSKQGSRQSGSAGGKERRDFSSSKDFKREEVQKEQSSDIPRRNDWRYYAATEEIAKMIASVPFNVMSGLPFRLQATWLGFGDTPGYTANEDRSANSVCAFDYYPGIGRATHAADSINMAASQLYSFVRHANSGAKNYEAADIMMHVLEMKDIYSSFFECKRALGISKAYTYYNHNIPKLLLKALGIDYQDIRANMAQYTARLNILASKINAIAVPKYFKAFERAAYISSNVFSDSNSIRGQFYIFRKAGYYKWSTTTSQQGTELIWTEYNNPASNNEAPVPFSTRLDQLEEQINSVFLDTDAQLMSGDILKAFGEEGCYQLMQTPSDYMVVPFMDEDILGQIENALVYGYYGASLAGMTINQSQGLISFLPHWEVTAAGQYCKPSSVLFNSHKEDPNYMDVLEWSRLMPTVEIINGQSENDLYVTSSGLEIPGRCYLWHLSYGKQQTPDGEPLATGFKSFTPSIEAADPNDERFLSIMQYDWHPCVYRVATAASSVPNDTQITFGMDIKVCTQLDDITLKNINDSAMYASFFAESLYKVAKPYKS